MSRQCFIVCFTPIFLLISSSRIKGIAGKVCVSAGKRARIVEMETFQEERTREPSGNFLAGEIDQVLNLCAVCF